MTSQLKQTVSVSLTPVETAMVEEAVERGDFASADEVVHEALRLWQTHEKARSLELNLLKQAYDEGVASGEGQPVDRAAFLASLKASQATHG